MAETGSVNPDIRLWEPELRRKASLGVLLGAAVIVIAGILIYGLLPEQAGWFLILAIVLVALLLAFEAAVLVTGIAREEGKGPAWLTAADIAPLPKQRGAGGRAIDEELYERIDLKCPECGNIFSAPDTGERPLHTTCPHCGAEGHVDGLPDPTLKDEAEPEQAHEHTQGHGHGASMYAPPASSGLGDLDAEALGEEADAEPDEEIVVISLKCPACATKFSVDDTGERPLRAACPGCGRSGRLK